MKKFLQILFVALLRLCQAMVSARKRLVLFAGPSKASAVDVLRFFQVYAAGDSDHVESLKGWLWPTPSVSLSAAPYEAYDHLVYQYEDLRVREIMLSSIEEAWNSSTYGVIVGSEAFDNILEGPGSNGLRAMSAIVERLGLKPYEVTVVLNYRMPRLNQYIQLWKSHNHNGEYPDYSEIVCRDTFESNWLLHRVATSMNPMKLAQVYREEGWKVAMIDLKGVKQAGLDPGNVVACEVLDHTNCKNGSITDVADVRYIGDWKSNFDEISAIAQKKLEAFFEDRDCYYKMRLEDDHGFSVLHRASVWSDCYRGQDKYYEDLALTPMLFEEIKEQAGCPPGKNPSPPPKNVTLVGKASWEQTAYSKAWKGFAVISGLVVAMLLLLFWRRKRLRKRSLEFENATSAVSPRGFQDSPEVMGDADMDGMVEVEVDAGEII